MWRTEELCTNQDLYEAAKGLLAISGHGLAEELVSDILPSPGIQESRALFNGRRLFRFCAVNFPCCLSLKLWRVFTSVEEDKIRESAILRVKYVLLWDHRGRSRVLLPHLLLQELEPALVSFLAEEAIPEERFGCLADAVSYVANQILTRYRPWWDGLRDYISSRARTELRKLVRILLNLPFPLDGDRFVTPLVKNLFPSILNSLESSRFQDGHNWRVGFVGAFCFAIQLMGTTRIDLTENLVYKMLKSTAEMVNSDRETEFVDIAISEVGMIVNRDSEKYSHAQFRFVLDLMSMINELHGVRESTKGLISRILIDLKKNRVNDSPSSIDLLNEWFNECDFLD